MTDLEFLLTAALAAVCAWYAVGAVFYLPKWLKIKKATINPKLATLKKCADCTYSKPNSDYTDARVQNDMASCLHPKAERRETSNDYHLGLESVVVSHSNCSTMRKGKCGKHAKYFLAKDPYTVRRQWSEIS